MKITVRSRLGVFHRLDIPTDLDAALATDELATERERVERDVAALALRESGFSYGEIAAALELTKTTAYRWVQNARQRYRKAARAFDRELAP